MQDRASFSMQSLATFTIMPDPLRPGGDEYAPHFASYVAHIGEEEDVLAVLARQLDRVVATFAGIPEARGDFRYEPGKWSMKEVVGHLSDTERVFTYRALRFARGDTTSLSSFDDQAYVRKMRAGERVLADMVGEWCDVRRATLALFRGLSASAWRRRGMASDEPISVRALAYIIAGHTLHHLEVLDARYADDAVRQPTL